ncbi:uncharacterized protein LOC129590570 [Paramacrobiotus metropolitanus]|uniref:uncharacterized protein LOC129590570 n=1 Tax=Paramacrobiotus metropolitanus TaxID=2943436 RepID=UPI002445FBDB|nr:uncharacterized protein LOC129590570 [Paramacrobiotus metropolitanus]
MSKNYQKKYIEKPTGDVPPMQTEVDELLAELYQLKQNGPKEMSEKDQASAKRIKACRLGMRTGNKVKAINQLDCDSDADDAPPEGSEAAMQAVELADIEATTIGGTARRAANLQLTDPSWKYAISARNSLVETMQSFVSTLDTTANEDDSLNSTGRSSSGSSSNGKGREKKTRRLKPPAEKPRYRRKSGMKRKKKWIKSGKRSRRNWIMIRNSEKRIVSWKNTSMIR